MPVTPRPVAILQELSNADKHRQLHLTTGHCGRDIAICGAQLHNCEVVHIQQRDSGPISDVDELALITLRYSGLSPQIHVQHQFVFGVTFADDRSTLAPDG
jgi:hypothetical protein